MVQQPEFGSTIQEGLDRFTADGYTGQFRTTRPGRLHCSSCDADWDPSAVHLERVCRVEGVSDPSDEVVVAALCCPNGHKGTEVFTYGPNADPMEADALRTLDDERVAAHRTR